MIKNQIQIIDPYSGRGLPICFAVSMPFANQFTIFSRVFRKGSLINTVTVDGDELIIINRILLLQMTLCPVWISHHCRICYRLYDFIMEHEMERFLFADMTAEILRNLMLLLYMWRNKSMIVLHPYLQVAHFCASFHQSWRQQANISVIGWFPIGKTSRNQIVDHKSQEQSVKIRSESSAGFSTHTHIVTH